MVALRLSNSSKLAYVDDEDAEWLRQFTWFLDTDGYAKRARPRSLGTPRNARMHKEIVEKVLGQPTPAGRVVDHRDGNRLNNRRENLRIATHAENSQNKSLGSNNSSRYIGVRPLGRRWRAEVKNNRRNESGAVCDTAEEAAHARDRRALELFGRFAKLNFPRKRGLG